MRTVTYKSIQDSVFRNAGIDPNSDTLTTEQKGAVADYINERVVEALQFAWWPELMRIEERAFRRTWRAVETYAAGDEVYYAEAYYEAIRANTGVQPGTSENDWTLTVLTNWYIELNRLGETPIGEVKQITRIDPRTKQTQRLKFALSENGIQMVGTNLPDTVWVEFRIQPPVFTSAAWATKVGGYLDGERVLNDDGEVYEVITINGEMYWNKVEMPFVFSAFVKRAATADYLNFVGQTDKADNELEKAYNLLVQSVDSVFGAQGMNETASVETY